MHFDKLNANGTIYKSKYYPFVLSLLKALLSAAEGHEWIIFRRSLKLITFLMALLPLTVFGATDGTRLLTVCADQRGTAHEKSTDSSHLPEIYFCEGYITAISEANNGMGYCRRTAAERSTSFEREAIQHFFTDHPERLHEPAHQLVLDALRQAFPCL